MTKTTIENLPSIKAPMDYLNDAIKVSLGSVPGVGPLTVALFESVFTAPIDKRKQEWLKTMAQIVNELCEQIEGLTPEKLARDDVFVSAQLQAANIAIRTHYKERLEALKNAVKNSFISNVDETKKMIFIRIIEDMTPLHFKCLHFLTFPNNYQGLANSRLPKNMNKSWGGPGEIWDESTEGIRSTDPLLDYIVADLHRLALVRNTKLYESAMHSNATQIGSEFVDFIQLGKIV